MSKTGRPPSAYRHDQSFRKNQPTDQLSGGLTAKDRKPNKFTTVIDQNLVELSEATVDKNEEGQPRLAWHREGRTSTKDGVWQHESRPLYTSEKVHPLTMIDQLRKPDAGVPRNLFDDFNGLPVEADYEFYQHSGRWQNRLIHGDSAQVMQTLVDGDRDGLAGQVQMIYFDPPYGINYNSKFQADTGKLDSSNQPVGDTVPLKAFRDSYKNGVHSYLDGIHEQLVLFHELLADTGSLFFQIGDEHVHLMALLCDEVFGSENRVATITWKSTEGSVSRTLSEVASYLLWYAKDKKQVKYHQLYEEIMVRAEKIEHMGYVAMLEEVDGTTRPLSKEERRDPDTHIPASAKIYQRRPLISMGTSTAGRTGEYIYDGVSYHPGIGTQWRVSTPESQRRSNVENKSAGNGAASTQTPPPSSSFDTLHSSSAATNGMDRLAELGRLCGSGPGGTLYYKQYEDEMPGRKINNVWSKPQRPLYNKRYVVQTADSVIKRCLLMSTDPGDLVFDPTCGSGVTAAVCEQWGRRWITVDASRVAVAIARRYLMTATHPWYRTLDDKSDPAAGFQMQTMQRVSAATLAYDTVNDPENTIYLVDKLLEDKKRKRLTGPFTVESHSPHRYLPLDDDGFADNNNSKTISKKQLGVVEKGENLDRLKTVLESTTILDSDGQPVLQIRGTLTSWPSGRLVTHQADCSPMNGDGQLLAGVMFAASDTTVTWDQMRAATAEAKKHNSNIKNLIVVASAYENNVPVAIGDCQVHKVVAARDLMIPGLKLDDNTSALTLLGEPDVLCEANSDGMLTIELLGYDTYDPGSGEVRCGGANEVDCWMIDTDHDYLSFFPRLVYLPAYKSGDTQIRDLIKTLGKDLDDEAADLLCGLTSQPFPAPEEGRGVLVKIITKAGTEMTTAVDLP